MLTRTSLLIQRLIDGGLIAVDTATGVVTGRRGRPLKVRVDRSGYCTVSLAQNHLPVHRLVAYAALGEPALRAGTIVTHIDGDRANNAAANLRLEPAAARARTVRPRLGWGVIVAGRLAAAFAERALAEEYAAWKYGPAAVIEPLR